MTVFSRLTRPHYLATEIAVNTLSPVAMIVSTSHSVSFYITPVVASLSLFSRTRKPRNFKSDSTSALYSF